MSSSSKESVNVSSDETDDSRTSRLKLSSKSLQFIIKFIPKWTKIKKVYFNSFYNELLATCIATAECGAKCEDAKQKIKDILNSNDVTNTIRGFNLLYLVWWFESLYSLNTNFHGFPCQVHPPEQMFIAFWMHLLMIFSSFFQAVEDDDAHTGEDDSTQKRTEVRNF